MSIHYPPTLHPALAATTPQSMESVPFTFECQTHSASPKSGLAVVANLTTRHHSHSDSSSTPTLVSPSVEPNIEWYLLSPDEKLSRMSPNNVPVPEMAAVLFDHYYGPYGSELRDEYMLAYPGKPPNMFMVHRTWLQQRDALRATNNNQQLFVCLVAEKWRALRQIPQQAKYWKAVWMELRRLFKTIFVGHVERRIKHPVGAQIAGNDNTQSPNDDYPMSAPRPYAVGEGAQVPSPFRPPIQDPNWYGYPRPYSFPSTRETWMQHLTVQHTEQLVAGLPPLPQSYRGGTMEYTYPYNPATFFGYSRLIAPQVYGQTGFYYKGLHPRISAETPPRDFNDAPGYAVHNPVRFGGHPEAALSTLILEQCMTFPDDVEEWKAPYNMLEGLELPSVPQALFPVVQPAGTFASPHPAGNPVVHAVSTQPYIVPVNATTGYAPYTAPVTFLTTQPALPTNAPQYDATYLRQNWLRYQQTPHERHGQPGLHAQGEVPDDSRPTHRRGSRVHHVSGGSRGEIIDAGPQLRQRR